MHDGVLGETRFAQRSCQKIEMVLGVGACMARKQPMLDVALLIRSLSDRSFSWPGVCNSLDDGSSLYAIYHSLLWFSINILLVKDNIKIQ